MLICPFKFLSVSFLRGAGGGGVRNLITCIVNMGADLICVV